MCMCMHYYYLVISADISILLWFCTCYKSLPSVLIFSSIGTLGSSYRTLGSSNRTLGSSYRTLGSSNRTLGSSYRTPGSSNRTPVSSYRTLGSSNRTLGSSYCTPGSSYRTPGSSYRTPGSSYCIPGSSYRTPGSGTFFFLKEEQEYLMYGIVSTCTISLGIEMKHHEVKWHVSKAFLSGILH